MLGCRRTPDLRQPGAEFLQGIPMVDGGKGGKHMLLHWCF